jgi:hypothetical protein
MTDTTDRVTALEAKAEDHERRISEHEAKIDTAITRDLRRESEHVSLMKSYVTLAESRDTLRHDLEEDFTFLGRAFDERVSDLTARIATTANGASNDQMAALLSEAGRILIEVTSVALDAERIRMQSWVLETIEKMQNRIIDLLDQHAKLVLDSIGSAQR